MTTELHLSNAAFREKGIEPREPACSVAVKRRVLLVDDDESVARLLRRVLAHYDVDWAETGERAKVMLESSSYDTIVSDISMPGMSGIELLQAVRQIDLEVPVVLMTGSPQVDTAMKALQYGALRYLQKPVKHTELQAIVGYAVQINELAKIRREAMSLLSDKARADSDRTQLEETFTRALGSL